MNPASFALGLLALFLAAPPVAAQETSTIQPSNPAVKTALTQVILRQLDAFRAGDFDRAYGFAAHEIREVFPVDVFEKMVRLNYPILMETATVDIGVALDDGQTGVVFVEITDLHGSLVFRYLLKREPAGWKIGGVEQVEKVPSGRHPLTA